jgi:hypothetical protein
MMMDKRSITSVTSPTSASHSQSRSRVGIIKPASLRKLSPHPKEASGVPSGPLPMCGTKTPTRKHVRPLPPLAALPPVREQRNE